MTPCRDCIHKGICRFEDEIKKYNEKITEVKPPKIDFSVNIEVVCHCSRKQTGTVPREGCYDMHASCEKGEI